VRVAVCDYRAGNIRSVEIALRRLGAEMVDDVASADLAVLPGVGSARSAMNELRAQGLDVALRERLADDRPVLGICLGLQLAVDWSEEDGGVDGLGLLPGKAVRVQARRVPRIGWAEVDGVAYYFAHSYAVETPSATAWSDGLVAEARHGSFLGVQFHPEKSGAAGARYLDGVLREVREKSLIRLPPERALGRQRRRTSGQSPHVLSSAATSAALVPRLIPCLDVAAGRVVKGVRFQQLREVGDPVELGAAYSDRGADELVFLDVKATLEERDTLVGVVRRVAEQLAIPFTVGGGIRSVADADQLLSAGADKVSVNSAALARPALVTELAEKVGSQAVVVAIDTEGGNVKTRAGTTETARTTIEWAKEAEARGAGEILLTSIDADGTREGYDLEITRAVADAVSVPVIASGGAGDASHVAAALEVAQAALLASILHEDPERLTSLREELRGMGVPLRDAA
jgi:cyclase